MNLLKILRQKNPDTHLPENAKERERDREREREREQEREKERKIARPQYISLT